MGVLVGIENIEEAIKKIADGGPHVMTMHKCVARQYFLPHAAKVYLATKSRHFSSYHPNLDVPKAEVDEVQRLGADGVRNYQSKSIYLRCFRADVFTFPIVFKLRSILKA